ncbi:peptidoglycan recognition protein [Streptomyces sodiiphilus]
MWSRRLLLCAAVLPLPLLVTWDAPVPEGDTPPDTPAAEPPSVLTPAPRPHIVTREAWGADESLLTEPVEYTGPTRAVFVHHTDHPDGYDCADVPDLLRAMLVDQITLRGWDDIGYNFVVDRCGTIYEGRAGSVDHNVLGAHTQGFNHDTIGVAALGSFEPGTPVPDELLEGIARVAAWKLWPGVDPRDRSVLTSSNDASRYAEGTTAEFHVVAGHRDAFQTLCPGDVLLERLPALRRAVARLREE